MLRPTGFDITFKYKCDCGTIHFITLEEAKLGNKLRCDVCCKIDVMEPIKSARVLVDFKDRISPSNKIRSSVVSPIIDEAHKQLKMYGYSVQSVAAIQDKVKARDSKQLIKEFLARQK
jgi:hypothetical protein